jgi:hypothetical protein
MKKFLIFTSLVIPFLFALSSLSLAQTIDACYNKYTGLIRIVTDASQCTRFERYISWDTEGTPGGIDKSKMYFNVCYGVTTCSCTAKEDILIAGGAMCLNFKEVLAQSAPLIADNINDSFYGVCYSIENQQNVVPMTVSVYCLRP